MKLNKTSKIGIVVVISLALLIWGINFLKGRDLFRTEKVFYARYKNVGGLASTTLVTLNGLKVGYVRDIVFAKDLSGDLIVKIAVFNDFPLPKGTSAEIASSDLLGSKVVKLTLGHSTELLQPGDSLTSKLETDLMTQVSQQLAPIKAKAERLIENLDSIVSAASRILDNESQASISSSIREINVSLNHLSGITGTLNEVVTGQKKSIAETFTNVHDLSSNLKSSSQKLNTITENVSTFSDSLASMDIKQTVAHLNKSLATLQSVLAKVDSADGSMGMLVNDKRLYQNLNYTVENLNRLLVDFRQNPKRYVHFSAIDLGREVTYENPKSNQKTDNLKFRVQLYTSDQPISVTAPLFNGFDEISEVKVGGKFYYVTPLDSSYEKVRMILNKAQLAFPQSILKAYENGKEISLKKALKSLKN